MSSAQKTLTKTILFSLSILLFMAAIAGATFLIVKSLATTKILSVPTNVILSPEHSLSWNEIEDATSYDIQIFNRTEDKRANIHVWGSMIEVNEMGIITYDISSNIEYNKNYCIMVRAKAQDHKASEYSLAIELEQIDPLFDKVPREIETP